MTEWDRPSPFVFDGPVPPGSLIGREQEADTLRDWARSGQSTVLIAPRRYGKTSLLHQVRADAEQHDRMPVILVDLYDVASLSDLVMRLERAWAKYAPVRLKRALGGVFAGAQVGLNVHGTGFMIKLADRPNTDPLPALHTLLDLPERVHAGERITVVFDEFQSLANIQGAEALVRTYAQQQRGDASYIFAGSQPSMLARMFTDAARPFYGQAQLFRLDRIPTTVLATALLEQFDATGRDASAALGEVIALSEGHPQRAMLLAHLLWQRVSPGLPATEATAGEVRAEALRRVENEVVALLDGLRAAEVKTVRAVVEYGTPLAARAVRDLNLPKTSAQYAAETLADRAILERAPDGKWRVVDPLLALWIRNRFPMRPQ